MFVRVAIDLALDRLFTYEVPDAHKEKLAVGQLLSVPFGHREARGFAMELVGSIKDGGSYKIKPITAIIEEVPYFSRALLALVWKVAEYTASPVETVLRTALPAAVIKKNSHPRELIYVEPAMSAVRVKMTARLQWVYDQIVRLGGGWMQQLCAELKTTPATIRQLGERGLVKVEVRSKRRNPLGGKRILPSKPLMLNEEQDTALKAICGAGDDKRRVFLLHGVTGSGKTEVYLQAIARELAEGRGAIVMVPEIALTPQTVQRFASRFGDSVAVLHSGLSDGERYDEWHRIRSGVARVVVGPRSAVWAPVANLGLIVVDEEHETSYKQEETPRYHARDVAVLRGDLENAKVLLGSATPSLESWMNVKRGKYELLGLRHRAGRSELPNVRIVEMHDGAIFSRELLDAVSLRLKRREQTILFLNRRGYSRSVVCEQCGFVVTCPDCGIPYTYHQSDNCLRCHICGGWIMVPEICPGCKARAFSYKGIGTQRAEATLKKCFPHATILRMDADSTSRKNSHDDILSAFKRCEADILIGTQMIAKGLDFPNVTLVGVLNADSSLNMPNFRASERTYQLLSQVAGRAGRAELPGEVIIQSFDASSPVIRAAARGDFADFADAELKTRHEMNFPPFCHMAIACFRSRDLKLVGDWAQMYANSLGKVSGLLASEAMPGALEKAEGWYRWQIVLRAKTAATLVKAWKWIVAARPLPEGIRANVDIDAYTMI